MMRALSAADIRELVPMRDAIEMMKRVFAAHQRGDTVSPLRTPVNMPDGSGVVLFMPAFVPASSDAPASTGAKIVSVFPGNQGVGLPTINALVVVVDPATGRPLGVLDGTSITALRTGAVSGAATDLLAREDARTVAVIGAGAQGVTQAAAVCAVRDIETIHVFDLSRDSMSSFRERLRTWSQDLEVHVSTAASAEDAVRNADVICTATTATSAVFRDDWLRDGAHINAIGAYTPQMQEIPDETIARSYIVVDEVEAALHEAGDLIQALERGAITRDAVSATLGAIVNGDAQPRSSEDQVTFFKSVGNAIQDLVVAGAALARATERDLGQQISLD